MKKFVIILGVFLGASVAIYLLVVNRNSYVKDKMWKYNSGAHFGDVLSFDENSKQLKLTNNNLDSENSFFCYGFRLIVKDPETGEKGVYSNKGKK